MQHLIDQAFEHGSDQNGSNCVGREKTEKEMWAADNFQDKVDELKE